MMTTKFLLVAGALAIGSLVACNPQAPQGEPIVPEYNGDLPPPKSISIPAFDWYIVSDEEMRDIYERSGKVVPNGGILLGFQGNHNGKQVIITPAPKFVDDEATCTLGHEVMHIAFGDYHKEVQARE